MRKLVAPILLLAVAACGEVNNFADAGEGAIDGNDLDADTKPDALATGPVTITATHFCCTVSGPAAGVDVIVVRPDGTAGDTVQTTADGTATVQVTAGDSVTTIIHEGSSHHLSTHLAVEPGDHLQVGDNWKTSGVARGTMNVTWPPHGGATSYTVFGPCSAEYAAAATTFAYPFRDDCGTGTFDIAVQAYGANGLVGWALLPNQTFAAGSTLAVGSLSFPGSFGISLSGIPAEVTYASTYVTGRVAGNGTIYGNGYGGTPAAGALTGSFPWGTSGAGTLVLNSFNRAGSFSGQASRESLPSSATGYNRTSVNLLPWVGYGVVDNLAARAVTWILDGTQPYDGAAVKLGYYRPTVNPTDSYDWTIVMPPGVTTLQFPELPAAYAAHDMPSDGDGYAGVTLYDFVPAETYRDFRAVPMWELDVASNGDDTPLDAPALRWSGVSNNN